MKELIKTPVFTLCSLPKKDYTFYRLECPGWVNIVPITENREIVFVKQFRFGIQKNTLEVPGGLMDKSDKNPLYAAKRELIEETGYGGGKWKLLGALHPNPAIMDNLCHMYLALNVKKIDKIKNDPDEHTEVVIRPICEVTKLIKKSVITHGLVINAISLLALHCPDILPWK